MDPTSVIERYLALISDPAAELADIEALLDPEMRFVERPNLVSPRGSVRDGRILRQENFDCFHAPS